MDTRTRTDIVVEVRKALGAEFGADVVRAVSRVVEESSIGETVFAPPTSFSDFLRAFDFFHEVRRALLRYVEAQQQAHATAFPMPRSAKDDPLPRGVPCPQ